MSPVTFSLTAKAYFTKDTWTYINTLRLDTLPHRNSTLCLHSPKPSHILMDLYPYYCLGVRKPSITCNTRMFIRHTKFRVYERKPQQESLTFPGIDAGWLVPKHVAVTGILNFIDDMALIDACDSNKVSVVFVSPQNGTSNVRFELFKCNTFGFFVIAVNCQTIRMPCWFTLEGRSLRCAGSHWETLISTRYYHCQSARITSCHPSLSPNMEIYEQASPVYCSSLRGNTTLSIRTNYMPGGEVTLSML